MNASIATVWIGYCFIQTRKPAPPPPPPPPPLTQHALRGAERDACSPGHLPSLEHVVYNLELFTPA